MIKLLRKLLSLRPYRIVWTTTPYWRQEQQKRKVQGLPPTGPGYRKCNPNRIYLLTPARVRELEEAEHECLPLSVNFHEWERKQWYDLDEFISKLR